MNRICKFARVSALALAVLSAASSVHAQVPQKTPIPGSGPGNPFGVSGGNQLPWFSNPQVREQLKLNDTQLNGLNQAYQNSYQNYVKGYNSLDPNLSPTARQQQIRQLQQSFNKDYATAAGQHFTVPAQQQRYYQLYLQYQGYGAFNDPAVAEKLKLTQAQRDQLNRYHQDWSTQLDKLGSMYQTDRDQATRQYTILQSQYNTQLANVLTTQQAAAWQQIIGNSHNFAPDVYFGSPRTAPGGKK